jgi:plastocyanin
MAAFLLQFTVQTLSAQPFYEVAPLPFNTSYADEAAAVPYADGLIYCSNRQINTLVNKIDINNQPLYYFYFVPKKDSLKWDAPHPLSKDMAINANSGPCSVSADGNVIYYTLNNREVNGIFTAHKAGDKWTDVRPFKYNSPDYTTAHPSLSRDGGRLFFASDMPGGYGGFDIYCCEWTPDGWGTPKNLGTQVNTPENELYPFIQTNGTLYFSSRAHQPAGGLDIFCVREINGKWELRHHLEAPVNSEYDDFAYVATDAEGTEGYFSSNRNGKNIDVFSFLSLFPTFTECNPQEENNYAYEFFDPGAEQPDTLTFIYQWDLGDGTVKQGKTVEHTFASPGHYIIRLNAIDSLTGEVAKNVATYDDFHVLDIEQPFITADETVEAGTPLSLDASKTYLPELDIREYYWMPGDGTRLRGKHAEHVFTAPGTYRICLGVIGISKETGEEKKVCAFRELVVTEKRRHF